jgi:hypothetical protein
MASDPHVTAAFPIPVAAEPEVARLRRHADDLYSGGRGSDSNGVDVDRGCGHRNGTPDDTAAKQYRGSKHREQHWFSQLSAFHWFLALIEHPMRGWRVGSYDSWELRASASSAHRDVAHILSGLK